MSDDFPPVEDLVVAVEFLERFPSAAPLFLGYYLRERRLGRLLASASHPAAERVFGPCFR